MDSRSVNVVLITGSAGFCGSHLIQALSTSNNSIVGFDLSECSRNDSRFYIGDINDISTLRSVLHTTKPHTIFHLAALTNPTRGYRQLHEVNALGTLSLLNAVREIRFHSTVLVTSSSAVYGRVSPHTLPISENQSFAPTNSYASSKVAQEMIAYQQFAQHKLNVIRTRAFNLTGPGESARFVTSTFARQIAEIEAGMREPVLNVGNLDAVRDFTDVRDAVRAYQLLAASGESGEVYNVCSGQGTSIKEILNGLLALSVADDITVRVDPARFQPADVPIQVGDASKLRALTGWTPAIPLRQTLEDVLNYWRKKVKEESI